MIAIDGATGEGGGQVLRTSLALSAVTNEACRIINIRKNRSNPGMQTQHLEAAKALAQLCNAETKGLEMHSTEIEFIPGKIESGKINISIPTAGSVALVLQGMMIAGTKKEIHLQINGGATHGKWAPPITYVINVLMPLLKRVNYEGYVDIEKYGYYPKGGAKLSCSFIPKKLKPLELLERGRIVGIEGISHASKLLQKAKVAERQKNSFMKRGNGEYTIFASYFDTLCEGSAFDVWIETENSFLGIDALGEKEKSAEDVGKEAAEKLNKLLQINAPLDEHAEDQLLPYMAIAGSGRFRYHHLTQHTRTNISVIEKFLPVKFTVYEKEKILSCENV